MTFFCPVPKWLIISSRRKVSTSHLTAWENLRVFLLSPTPHRPLWYFPTCRTQGNTSALLFLLFLMSESWFPRQPYYHRWPQPSWEVLLGCTVLGCSTSNITFCLLISLVFLHTHAHLKHIFFVGAICAKPISPVSRMRNGLEKNPQKIVTKCENTFTKGYPWGYCTVC